MCADTSLNTEAAYRVVVEPCGKRLRVVFAGETIADSTDTLVLHETRLPPVTYFPRRDARMQKGAGYIFRSGPVHTIVL